MERWLVIAPNGGIITNRSTGGSFTFAELEAWCREHKFGDLLDYRFVRLSEEHRLDQMTGDTFSLTASKR